MDSETERALKETHRRCVNQLQADYSWFIRTGITDYSLLFSLLLSVWATILPKATEILNIDTGTFLKFLWSLNGILVDLRSVSTDILD